MESMTGYGSGVSSANGAMVKVEVRGLNQKILDIQAKLPSILLFAEGVAKEIARNYVSRGRVEIFVSYKILSSDLIEIAFSDSVLREFYQKLKPLMEEGIIKDGFSPSDIMNLPEFFSISTSEKAASILKSNLEEACESAFKEFKKQRIEEGERLKAQFKEGIKALSSLINLVDGLEKKQKEVVISDFKKRVLDVMPSFDPQRLEMEAVVASEKSDIKEEVVRLKSHLISLENLIRKENEDSGRKIDFLLQELQREASTLLAKSSLLEITSLGLEIRKIVEQLREQAANVA